MKNLLLAALLLAAPVSAMANADADEAARSEATRLQLVAMVACDPSAHLAARFMGAFVGVALLESMSEDPAVHKDSEKALADFIAGKTCSDMEASTKTFTALGSKLSGENLDARAKTDQGKAEENELAAAILEMLKAAK